MSFLKSVTKGIQPDPPRVILYGPPGVGKTTFGANMPSPIFMPCEDGCAAFDVARFPRPRTTAEAEAMINELAAGGHEFKTLVVDTIDALERVMMAEVALESGAPDFGSIGYGKGYPKLAQKMSAFTLALSELRQKAGMNIVLLAHASTRKHHDPVLAEEWDHQTLAVDPKASAPILSQWCDTMLFADFDKAVSNKDGKIVARTFDKRVMLTEYRPAHEAKNRYELPYRMDFSAQQFIDGVKAFWSKKSGK